METDQELGVESGSQITMNQGMIRRVDGGQTLMSLGQTWLKYIVRLLMARRR